VVDLAGMRIFLSNDDGIDALGPDCRERVARRPNDDIWIVAPEKDQSGASHSPSLSEPVRCRSLGKRKFAVQGTPTDSVLMGILDLVSAPRPNLVLSGINRGGGQPGRSHNIFWHCGCCYGGDTARNTVDCFQPIYGSPRPSKMDYGRALCS